MECTQCQKQFSSRFNLRRHQKRFHKEEGLFKLKCQTDKVENDITMGKKEKTSWLFVLEELSSKYKLRDMTNIYKDPNTFEKYINNLRKAYKRLERRYSSISNGKTMRQIQEEIVRLRKYGYDSSEATKAAWSNRRYLIRKLMKTLCTKAITGKH